MNIFERLKNNFGIDEILTRNTTIGSLNTDYKSTVWFLTVAIPFVMIFAGFLTDFGVVQSIIKNATQNFLAAGLIGLIVALLIQLGIYSIPEKVGKHLRFCLNSFRALGLKSNKRAWKDLFYTLFFLIISVSFLKGSLFLNTYSEAIVMSVAIEQEKEKETKEGTHNKLLFVSSSKNEAQKIAKQTYEDELKFALSVYNLAIKENPKATLLSEKINIAHETGKRDWAESLNRELNNVMSKELAEYKAAKEAAKKTYLLDKKLAVSIASTGVEEITGDSEQVKKWEEKSRKMLEVVLKYVLIFANVYVFIAGLFRGFSAKDLKENEDKVINLVDDNPFGVLDDHLTKK